jgi:ABC-type nitrate/sulfonate/bicarbonate transport system substrate-binding protein
VNNEEFEKTETVVATLRQAIAEAEKQPVHASDISQECVDETAKDRHDLVYRLRKRAEIRRQIPDRKSVQEGQPDRIADLLEEAADALEKREWAEQPDLARVGEVGVWGEEKNT